MKNSFHLDPSSRKFSCPQCNEKRFVRYISSETSQYLAEQFGRCDREVKCGYHQMPEKGLIKPSTNQVPQLPVYLIAKQDFQRTLSNYQQNNLYLLLTRLFGEKKAGELCYIYQVGTSKKWPGACIFWQITAKGVIGQGKIMLFDSKTGRRIKHPFPHVYSVHKVLGKENQKPEYRCYGEHIINRYPNKPIALVESEKTAIIMTGIDNSYNWIASGGLSMISTKRLFPFKHKKIVFYPDLGAYGHWERKAEEINRLGYQITVSDLLEKKARREDQAEGYDIADYFIKNIQQAKSDSPELANMKAKNPCLQKLINQFRLVEIKVV